MYSVVTCLTIVIMAHSAGSTDGQIQLAQGSEPQGSMLYLELTTQNINQFLRVTLESLSLLAFVALLMERALEVFVLGFRSEYKMYLEQNARFWEKKVQRAKEEQDNVATACNIPLHEADLALQQFHELIAQEKAKTKTQIQLIALLVGIMLGVAGIRVLEPIFSVDSLLSMPGIQQVLFRFLDIGITGLAVAGGSDGIHLISKKLGDSLGQQAL